MNIEFHMKRKVKVASSNLMAVLALALFASCAFDLSHVKQQSAAFAAVATPAKAFILTREVKASIGTGFATRLKAGTRWQQAGTIEQGAVFATKDQVLTVEASNIHEAQMVVADGCLKGFYLPVEKTFVSVSKPIRLETQTVNSNPP